VEEYITKPYDSDELLELVTIQLNRYFQLQGLAQQGFEDLKQSILQLLHTDFRTPLHSVTDYSNALATDLERAQTPNDLKQSLRGIQMGSQQLSGLVENFILLAELRTGEAQNAFDVRSIPHMNVTELLQLAVESAEGDGILEGVAITWGPLLTVHPTVLVDADVYVQTLRRLVEVGIQTCVAHHGRTLTFSVRQLEQEMQIEMVRDGQPFVAPLLDDIERLLRMDEEQIADRVRYGSALCVVHWVSKLHGGRATLSDNTADHVAFTLHLPFYQQPSKTADSWLTPNS
jgi:K+-sensing histidine kinase KdpD